MQALERKGVRVQAGVLQVDIYSMGIILWELVTLQTPSRGNLRAMRIPEECPPEVARLIEQCLVADNPDTRPTAAQIFDVIMARCASSCPRGAHKTAGATHHLSTRKPLPSIFQAQLDVPSTAVRSANYCGSFTWFSERGLSPAKPETLAAASTQYRDAEGASRSTETVDGGRHPHRSGPACTSTLRPKP